MVTIDNQLLQENRPEGLLLNMDKMVLSEVGGEFHPLKSYSTSKCYPASKGIRALIGDSNWPVTGRRPIGDCLLPELFRFKRAIPDDPETHGYLEQNLLNPMSQIITSKAPLLTAAQVNTEVEFDRTYRTLRESRRLSGQTGGAYIRLEH